MGGGGRSSFLTWFRRSAVALACVFGLAATVPVSAQEAAAGAVRGRVLNVSSGNYLANARVRVAGTELVAFTNPYGEYRLSGVPAGPATLEVFYTGLPEQTATVTVPAGGVATHDFSMERGRTAAEPRAADDGTITLSEFVVAGEREYDAQALAINEQRFAANLRNVVSTDAFGEVNQGNLGEFLKHVPGVTIEYDGQEASGIQVRGFTSNYTAVTLDGGMLASAASPASTQNHSRSFGLEQANINNLSRIEVVKLPTPDMAANLLGGSVNLVSKSAFERARPELRVASYFSFNSENTDLKKTGGPDRGSHYKILPSVSLTWTQPINDHLGIVVTAGSTNNFTQTVRTVPTRNWGDGGDGATVDNPQTTRFDGDVAMRRNERNSAGIKIDYKPWDRHVVSLSLQANAFSGFSRTNRLSYNAGRLDDWGESFSLGEAGRASATQSVTVDDKHGLSQAAVVNYRFDGEDWEVDAGGSYSTSWNRNRDTDKGFFRSYNARAYNVTRINFRDIDNETGAPGVIELFDASGNQLDTNALSNYTLQNVYSQPTDSQDWMTEARLGVTRHIDGLPFPLSIKGGAFSTELSRDIDYASAQYNYYGASGIANNAANTAADYLDPDFNGVSPGLTYPSVQWASPYLMYEASQAHPELFRQTSGQAADTLKNAAVRSPFVKETVTAGYLMADAQLFKNRVRVVGGVRYELTETEGSGYKQTYGTPPYERRATHNSREYDGYYPSAHVTVNITDDLLLRAAYAKTIGRPRPVDIVPNLFVGENIWSASPPGWVVSNNTELKPWEADNFDITLQYYLPRNGLISAGVFRKDISNFFGKETAVIDETLIEFLGLTEEQLGWTYETRTNVGDARIDGLELSFEQSLGLFATWLEPFTVFANYTKLELEGSNTADFNDFIPETANLGLKLTYGKFFFLAKWNYRGRQLREYDDEWFPGAGEYIRAYPTIDVNAEYQLTKNVALFATGRNILDEPYQWERSGPVAPGWSTLTSSSTYGAQYTLGVRATF